MRSIYTAYGSQGKVIKKGVVEYDHDDNQDTHVCNFMEAVCQDVGENLFETEVVGVRD